MKKMMCLCLSAVMALTMLTGCEAKEEANTSEMPTSKIVINFEGSIASVDENRITLDEGTIVVINENTVFSDANGTVEKAELEEGDFVQGYTEDDPEAAEISAKRIHIVK